MSDDFIRIVRWPEIGEMLGVSRNTIDRWEKSGKFPKKIYLGENIIGYKLSEINKWIKEKNNVD